MCGHYTLSNDMLTMLKALSHVLMHQEPGILKLRRRSNVRYRFMDLIMTSSMLNFSPGKSEALIKWCGPGSQVAERAFVRSKLITFKHRF